MGCLQATAGADIVMLDNRSPGELADMAKALKTEFPSLIIEGSGVSATCARAAVVVRSYSHHAMALCRASRQPRLLSTFHPTLTCCPWANSHKACDDCFLLFTTRCMFTVQCFPWLCRLYNGGSFPQAATPRLCRQVNHPSEPLCAGVITLRLLFTFQFDFTLSHLRITSRHRIIASLVEGCARRGLHGLHLRTEFTPAQFPASHQLHVQHFVRVIHGA